MRRASATLRLPHLARATLEEGGVDLERIVAQARQVFDRSGRRLFLQADAVSTQEIGIGGGKALIGAAFTAAAQNKLVGRCRLDESGRAPEAGDEYRQQRQDDDQQVPPRVLTNTTANPARRECHRRNR
ncbi:MAG: hypothetical protein IPG52_08405 [Rhodocyclaceae bacterium]|nr:hypothetical protein [Rhodocyclaceae bacterium]